jgi:hypothetical protein
MIIRTNTTRAKRGLALGLFLGTSALASASGSLNYQFISPELPVGTRCLLVASTQDSDFGQPGDLAGVQLTQGAVFGQDNVILAVLTAESLPASTTGVSGRLTLDFTGQLNAGDPLRLYGLPGLAPSATVQPLGGGFVDFRADLPADGGTIGCSLPADGATDSLYSIACVYGGTTTFPGSVPATIATDPHGEDPDGDQMGDLLEFAMGVDIYQSTTPDQPLVSLVNGGVDLSFDFALRDDLAIHGLVLGVESSLTLLDGSWFPVTMQPSATPGRWGVVVPTPTGPNARQFFRFKLVTP